MRKTRTSGGLKVYAVAGTYVVSFGFDLPQADCAGLLGFSIHRTDHTEDEAAFLMGMKAFAETDPGFPSGSQYSTENQPIQSFQWADYSAKPGHDYTYRVMARKGAPAALITHAEVSVRIQTESPEGGSHDVYFNRGVAASQEYVRRFGDRSPDEVQNNQAYIWLSRGLYEALEDFIRSADPARDKLRVAAYEFTYDPFLALLRDAIDRGVDIRICYDGRESGEKMLPGKPNRDHVAAAGLSGVSVERTRPKSAISHNKFIVKVRDGNPVSVWTGGTNFSSGGIFGHSNVAHLVEEPAIAAKYLEYWESLATDPTDAALTAAVETITPLPAAPPPKGTTPIFSPRASLEALDLYARYAMSAKEGLMMTFAFGMNERFKTVYRTSTAPFRLALLERAARAQKDKAKQRAEEQEIQRLRNMPENIFAIGSFIKTNAIDGWVKERLSGLNVNVRYVHNKFMLVDPLGNDPIVIAGSANFSDASTEDNDENMVIVRGNRRVADIYLGEFMRLWTHHAFRESRAWAKPGDPPPKPLRIDDWWRDSFGNTERATRRKFFARSNS
jgi:phosphatidylserine/phosphatidylglycerophosphate/cardiolipin synthase-like enzyme